MKPTILAFIFISFYHSIKSQDFNSMAGDWMRVGAEYTDGEPVAPNHHSRVYLRFHFTNKEVYQIIGNNYAPFKYLRQGNNLKVEPARTFLIEQYTNKSLMLSEPEGDYQLRYRFVSIDSFQRMGTVRYDFAISGADTVYTMALGLEPIFAAGRNEWINNLFNLGSTIAMEFTYVVQKDGSIGDVEITATTDPKKNKRIIQLIKKTSGKWIPATLHGKPVNVKVKDSLSMAHRSY